MSESFCGSDSVVRSSWQGCSAKGKHSTAALRSPWVQMWVRNRGLAVFAERAGLSAEIPTAVSGLIVTCVGIEVWAVKISAISIPAGAPRRRTVGCRSIGRWRSVGRWWRRSHNHCRWGKCTTDDSANPEAKQAGAYRIAIMSSVGGRSHSDHYSRGGDRESFARMHGISPFVGEPQTFTASAL